MSVFEEAFEELARDFRERFASLVELHFAEVEARLLAFCAEARESLMLFNGIEKPFCEVSHAFARRSLNIIGIDNQFDSLHRLILHSTEALEAPLDEVCMSRDDYHERYPRAANNIPRACVRSMPRFRRQHARQSYHRGGLRNFCRME